MTTAFPSSLEQRSGYTSARRAVQVPHTMARSLAAFSLGAVAIGACAIGAVAIGRLAIGRARVRRVEIDELVVRKLHVTEAFQVPSNSGQA